MNFYKKYIQKYSLPFFIAVACVGGESFCDLLGPSFMAHIINDGIQKNSLNAVYHWGAFMLVATAAGAIFAVVRNIISSIVSQQFGAGLRHDLFDKILHFSVQSSDHIENGSLITRMTNDITQLTNFVNSLMRIFIKAPVTCIGSMILASMLNFRLSLIIYATIALVGLLLYISMNLSYPRYAKMQQAVDALNTRVQEYLMGIRLVKAFGTYAHETDKFNTDNANLMQKNINAQIVITLFTPVFTLISGGGIILILLCGSNMFRSGSANPGEVSAFVIYMGQILNSLLHITNIFNNFVRTKASSQRIHEVFSASQDFPAVSASSGLAVDGCSDELSSCHAEPAVSFEHVTFAYPEGSGKAALTDISFSVARGQSLAIIGPTGSGKSTATWLLLRMYDADAGTIRFGGRNIRTMGSREVRENIALVPQKPMLFSGSIRSNLYWGNPHASGEEIQSALRIADADFILQTKDGLDTELGSGGVNLSGGQKQRLSIARALLKNAPVLVLDDATSALDAITEAKVRQSILAGNKNAAVIFITQRCSTAMAASSILVLEDGECRGYGTHHELLRTCPVYRDIYNSQLGGTDDAK